MSAWNLLERELMELGQQLEKLRSVRKGEWLTLNIAGCEVRAFKPWYVSREEVVSHADAIVSRLVSAKKHAEIVDSLPLVVIDEVVSVRTVVRIGDDMAVAAIVRYHGRELSEHAYFLKCLESRGCAVVYPADPEYLFLPFCLSGAYAKRLMRAVSEVCEDTGVQLCARWS